MRPSWLSKQTDDDGLGRKGSQAIIKVRPQVEQWNLEEKRVGRKVIQREAYLEMRQGGGADSVGPHKNKPSHSICLASSGNSSQRSIFRVFAIKYRSLSRDLSKMTKGAPVVTAGPLSGYRPQRIGCRCLGVVEMTPAGCKGTDLY